MWITCGVKSWNCQNVSPLVTMGIIPSTHFTPLLVVLFSHILPLIVVPTYTKRPLFPLWRYQEDQFFTISIFQIKKEGLEQDAGKRVYECFSTLQRGNGYVLLPPNEETTECPDRPQGVPHSWWRPIVSDTMDYMLLHIISTEGLILYVISYSPYHVSLVNL